MISHIIFAIYITSVCSFLFLILLIDEYFRRVSLSFLFLSTQFSHHIYMFSLCLNQQNIHVSTDILLSRVLCLKIKVFVKHLLPPICRQLFTASIKFRIVFVCGIYLYVKMLWRNFASHRRDLYVVIVWSYLKVNIFHIVACFDSYMFLTYVLYCC